MKDIAVFTSLCDLIVVIAHDEVLLIDADDDFALILVVSDDGWPSEWLWMDSGFHGTARSFTNPNSTALSLLFEDRAILRPDGQVILCHHGEAGWNERALEWWRAAKGEDVG